MANDNDGIITLKTAKGEDIEFVEIAGIAYKGKYYAILQPVILLDGMKDDEALVFRVTQGKDGDKFDIETDDKIIDAVFQEYDRLLDEKKKNNAQKTDNRGSKKASDGKSGKKSKPFLPLILGVVFAILGSASASLNWGEIATTILFLCAFGCAVWFIIRIVKRSGKKRKGK